MPDGNSSDWRQYQYFVLEELKRCNLKLDEMDKVIQEMRDDVTTLKVKAGVWGAVAGFVAAIVIKLFTWAK